MSFSQTTNNKMKIDLDKLSYLSDEELSKYNVDVPVEVLRKMCEHQINQGNILCPQVFSDSLDVNAGMGGFKWKITEEGFDFWEKVLSVKAFEVFFKKYPKKENTESLDKDYEILIFEDTSSCKTKFKKGFNGKFYYKDSATGHNIKDMLNTGRCVKTGDFRIYSVRRLSDNKVFTVGDIAITHLGRSSKIKSFEMVENTIRVNFINLDGSFIEIIKKEEREKEMDEEMDKDMEYEIVSIKKADNDIWCNDSFSQKGFHDRIKEGWMIKTVKRLSDGKTFTVGEEVLSHLNRLGEITGFYIKDSGRLVVRFDGDITSYLTSISKKEDIKYEYKILSLKPKGYPPCKIRLLSHASCLARVNTGHHTIYSIIRLSDNKIFTIGDEVKYGSTKGNITGFDLSKFSEETIIVEFGDGRRSFLGVVKHTNPSAHRKIADKHIKETNKKVNIINIREISPAVSKGVVPPGNVISHISKKTKLGKISRRKPRVIFG